MQELSNEVDRAVKLEDGDDMLVVTELPFTDTSPEVDVSVQLEKGNVFVLDDAEIESVMQRLVLILSARHDVDPGTTFEELLEHDEDSEVVVTDTAKLDAEDVPNFQVIFSVGVIVSPVPIITIVSGLFHVDFVDERSTCS